MTQDEALEILKAGHNVYLTGAAGSGKTYLLNTYIDLLKERKIYVGITASTGIAATHMRGFTIHSWAGIGIKNKCSDEEIQLIAEKKRIAKRFREAKTLIIDEVSMLDKDRLNLIEEVARYARANFEPFGGLQVVLCGDFFQLPPVSKWGEEPPEFAYKSSTWGNMNLKVCYLEEQHRQGDKPFIEVLNAIRRGTVDETTLGHLHGRLGKNLTEDRVTKLYSHNRNVDAENARELGKLPGEVKTYEMETSGAGGIVDQLIRGCLAQETLTLKKDAKVMFVKNNPEEGYVNGTLGTVIGFDEEDLPVVKLLDGREIKVRQDVWSIEEDGKTLGEIWQIPLRLAWAITIHKSQGMTLDAAEIDLRGAFEKGMGYVALSRVRSLAGIRLLGLNDTALEVSPDVLKFDEELQEQSEEIREEFKKMSKEEREKKQKAFLGEVPKEKEKRSTQRLTRDGPRKKRRG